MEQHDRAPTPEEFEAARTRELARLSSRLSDLTGKEYLKPEDQAILEGDMPQLETQDQETVRCWSTNKGERLRAAG